MRQENCMQKNGRERKEGTRKPLICGWIQGSRLGSGTHWGHMSLQAGIFPQLTETEEQLSCSVPSSLWSSNPGNTAVNEAVASAGWCSGPPSLSILTSPLSWFSGWPCVEEVPQLCLHGAEGRGTQPAAGWWRKRCCHAHGHTAREEARLRAERDMWCKPWELQWEVVERFWSGREWGQTKTCPKEN